MTEADGPRGRGSTPKSVPVRRRWRSPFPQVETSTRPTPQHRRMSVPPLFQSWQEGYPHELEHRVEPRSARPWFNPADNPLVRKAAATVGSDYPTAVTPSVTSPTMVLRRNIAHRYTDSVTIMAVVRRRTARRALVTPALARGPQGPMQRSVFL
jgi:hypothetical protein